MSVYGSDLTTQVRRAPPTDPAGLSHEPHEGVPVTSVTVLQGGTAAADSIGVDESLSPDEARIRAMYPNSPSMWTDPPSPIMSERELQRTTAVLDEAKGMAAFFDHPRSRGMLDAHREAVVEPELARLRRMTKALGRKVDF